MLSLDGQIEVQCSLHQAWDLFCRFGDVARLIPTVQDVEVDGDRVHGWVAIKLGVLSVSSRVSLEVTERKELACLKAEGLSYLGETIREQIAHKGVRGIDKDSVGRLKLHLDLRPIDDNERILLVYNAEVEAEGRLKRIYQSILKNKAPAMIEQFAENVRNVLEQDDGAVGAPAPDSHSAQREAEGSTEARAPSGSVSATKTEGDAEPTALARATRRPWWRRLLSWLVGLFSRKGSRP